MASPFELKNHLKVLEDEHRKEEEENFSSAMHLVLSFVPSMSLQCAIELGVFNIIAKADEGAKLSPAEIVAQMPTSNPDAPTMLDRILRLLASHSLLSCSVVSDDNGSNVQRQYGLSPVSKYFVSAEDGVSMGALLALGQDKVMLDVWPHLKDSILEGGLGFNRAHGVGSFEYPGVDPRGFDHLKQLVDVGGGLGVNLKIVTSKYPHIKGINFDLPHVIENAPSYPGIEHVGGDMFKSVPFGDAIFMKWILHDWDDEHCLKLLKNCYKAIPDNGNLIVVDAILPIMPENSFAVKNDFALDVAMMTQSPGGKERTQQEFLTLANSAGFSGINFVCCVCNFFIMEFYK